MSSPAENNGARQLTFMWFENCSMKGPPPSPAPLLLPLRCLVFLFKMCLPQNVCRDSTFHFPALSLWLLLLMHLTGPGLYLKQTSKKKKFK